MDETAPVLPACCYASETAERAEVLYCAYQRGGPLDRAGLAWDSQPCPTWTDLLSKAATGDLGAAGVIAKWRAVAEV